MRTLTGDCTCDVQRSLQGNGEQLCSVCCMGNADDAKRRAEAALTAWAAGNAKRDQVICDAVDAGISVNRIHQITGVARTTIDRILRAEESAESPQ